MAAKNFLIVYGLPLALFFLLFFFVYPCIVACNGNDSYMYLLLGHAVLKGGYSIDLVRDYGVFKDWPVPSNSFPPLFPIVVGLVDRGLGLGPASGAAVNLILTLVLFVSVFKLSLSAFGRSGLPYFLCIFGLLFLSPSYRFELSSGGSIPLQLTLTVATFAVLKMMTKVQFSKADFLVWSALGFLVSLLSLNRFDHVALTVAAILVLMLIVVLVPDLRLRAVGAVLISVVTPASVYNAPAQ